MVLAPPTSSMILTAGAEPGGVFAGARRVNVTRPAGSGVGVGPSGRGVGVGPGVAKVMMGIGIPLQATSAVIAKMTSARFNRWRENMGRL